MLAGLSIMGVGKAHISALTMIPLVALGVPVFDTLLAPVRRFVVGKKMFYPDAGHTHHMLVRKGLSARRAVLIIYLVTVVLCVLAVVLVNLRNERVGLVFAVLGVGAVLGMRKLGYLEYLGMDKFYGWLKDITDEAGFSSDRRTFLGMQMNIAASRNVEELWEHVKQAVQRLDFDMVELYIHGPGQTSRTLCYSKDCNGFDFCIDVQNDNLMKLELPLLDENNERIGILWLIKDMEKAVLNDYTFRRVEQLRRPVVRALSRMR
jgi:UDP-GlcNAc:undecaprenyl-phosphate GlcNAc-1-phosphate transferase